MRKFLSTEGHRTSAKGITKELQNIQSVKCLAIVYKIN